MSDNYPNLTVLHHPVIEHKLARMRDVNTPHFQFQTLLEEISIFLFYEASAALETVPYPLDTPLEPLTGRRLKHEVLLVPILRAGIGISSGITKVWSEAVVGMIGMYRDHDTLQPVDYFLRLPANLGDMTTFLLDPMLATGGSAAAAAAKLKEKGARRLVLITLIAAPEGVAHLAEQHPDMKIYTAALDRQLNEKGYILPGLGDAGDRYFGV